MSKLVNPIMVCANLNYRDVQVKIVAIHPGSLCECTIYYANGTEQRTIIPWRHLSEDDAGLNHIDVEKQWRVL